MAYLEELLPEFRNGAKIRCSDWDKSCYLYFESTIIWSEDNKVISFIGDDLLANNWEFYQEPIDWQYIIDNKCLCWFWDDKFNWAVCGTLGIIEKDAEHAFIMFDEGGNRSNYKHCRPVRRDEVTFYEEKE